MPNNAEEALGVTRLASAGNRSRDRPAPHNGEAVGKVHGARDADPPRNSHLTIRDGRARGDPKWAAGEIASVVPQGETKGTPDLAWTAEQLGLRSMVALRSHEVDAGQRLQSAEKDCSGRTAPLGCDIQAVVHPIAEVDVGIPGRAEHDRVASGSTSEGVGSGVGRPRVRLRLDDPSGQ